MKEKRNSVSSCQCWAAGSENNKYNHGMQLKIIPFSLFSKLNAYELHLFIISFYLFIRSFLFHLFRSLKIGDGRKR